MTQRGRRRRLRAQFTQRYGDVVDQIFRGRTGALPVRREEDTRVVDEFPQPDPTDDVPQAPPPSRVPGPYGITTPVPPPPDHIPPPPPDAVPIPGGVPEAVPIPGGPDSDSIPGGVPEAVPIPGGPDSDSIPEGDPGPDPDPDPDGDPHGEDIPPDDDDTPPGDIPPGGGPPTDVCTPVALCPPWDDPRCVGELLAGPLLAIRGNRTWTVEATGTTDLSGTGNGLVNLQGAIPAGYWPVIKALSMSIANGGTAFDFRIEIFNPSNTAERILVYDSSSKTTKPEAAWNTNFGEGFVLPQTSGGRPWHIGFWTTKGGTSQAVYGTAQIVFRPLMPLHV